MYDVTIYPPGEPPVQYTEVSSVGFDDGNVVRFVDKFGHVIRTNLLFFVVQIPVEKDDTP